MKINNNNNNNNNKNIILHSFHVVFHIDFDIVVKIYK